MTMSSHPHSSHPTHPTPPPPPLPTHTHTHTPANTCEQRRQQHNEQPAWRRQDQLQRALRWDTQEVGRWDHGGQGPGSQGQDWEGQSQRTCIKDVCLENVLYWNVKISTCLSIPCLLRVVTMYMSEIQVWAECIPNLYLESQDVACLGLFSIVL